MTGILRRCARSLATTATGSLDALLVAALGVIAVVPFGRLFVSYHFLALVGGAVLAAFVVSAAMSPGRPAGAALLCGIGALALYLVGPVFHVFVPTPDALGGVWDGLASSWARLLTATLPAAPTPGLIALPVLLGFAGSFAGVELARRTRSSAVPVVPPLCVFLAALAFTGKRPAGSLVLPFAVVALVLIVVLLRANDPRSRDRERAAPSRGESHDRAGLALSRGQLRSGVAIVGVTAVVASALGRVLPVAPSQARFDLHDYYMPPVEIRETVSPLARVQAESNDDSTVPLFSVRFQGVGPNKKIDRVPIAVLDRYDGTVWGTDATFARVGHILPAGPVPSIPTYPVRQEYEMGGATTSFLPSLERPRSVRGTDTAFDRVSGMLVVPAKPSRGSRYVVVSDVVPDPSEAEMEAARPGNDPSVSTLALPPPQGWPREIERAATSLFPSQAPNAYAYLHGLETEMRSERFGFNTRTVPGHSFGVLSRFLATPAADGESQSARVGSWEQYAAAFAILARVKGMPSRVVVGYHIDPVAAQEGKRVDVRPRDAIAWPEVNLNGVGWVRFDPTNAMTRPPVQAPLPPPLAAPGPTPTPTTGPQSLDSKAEAGGPGRTRVPVWPAVLAALIVALNSAVVGAKRLRRRRRRFRGSAAERIVGAWFEARERLALRGFAVSRSSTVTELAVRVEQAAGSEMANRIAVFRPLVDCALFAPDEPQQAVVDAAWDAEAGVAATARAGVGLVRRATAVLDPRPLLSGAGGPAIFRRGRR